LNFTQLRYFVEIVASGSITRAATELGIAQPALSRQIRLLEEHLGTDLLLRHGRGVELTEAGKLLLERAEFLLRFVEQTRVEVSSLAQVPTGHIRIGCPPSLAKSMVIHSIKEFRERFPNVTARLVEGSSDGLLSMLLADQLDMAILTTPKAHPDLSIHHLFDEEVWLFSPPGFCIKGSNFSLKQISSVPLMISQRPHGARIEIEKRMADEKLRMNIVLETNAWQVVKDLILMNVGFFIGPKSALQADLEADSLSGGPIADLRVSRCLARRSDRPIGRASLEFRNLVLANTGSRGAA
jgi:LysR family nitrogen assimilation transcriptional regulator